MVDIGVRSVFGDVASSIHDVVTRAQDSASDVVKMVKTYPAHALLGAIVVGFVAGRMLRRD